MTSQAQQNSQKVIALVGAGELGSRHLQALAKISFPAQVYVVDPSSASLEKSRQRFGETQPNKQIQVLFSQELQSVPGTVDLAIIATNSDVRLRVLNSLLSTASVRTLILEKVLFSSTDELSEALKLVQDRKANAYVNCPKRTFAAYRVIKKQIEGCRELQFKVEGESWGLACNAIHFIDLMSFFCDEEISYQLDVSQLDSEMQQSKRAGFVEFTGTLKAYFGKNRILEMTSTVSSNVDFRVRLQTEKLLISFSERTGLLEVRDLKMNLLSSEIFKTPYQSELTNSYVEKSFSGHELNIPTLKSSAQLHRPLLSELLKFYNHLTMSHHSRLPVT